MSQQPPPTILKAILFDLDDTLIDWSGRAVDWVDYRRNHLHQVFDFVHNELYPLDAPDIRTEFIATAVKNIENAWVDAYTSMVAPHIGTCVAQAFQSVGVPTELLNRERLLQAYDWGPVEGVVAFPDVLDVLPQFVAAGLTLGVVTNSSQPMWMRDVELRAFNLIDYLNGPRISAADVGFLKPHPYIFQTALASLNLPPEAVVFVGDNPRADIVGAQQLSIKAVLRYLANDSNRQHSTTPDGEIENFYDLLTLLDAWYPGWRPVPQVAV